MLITPESNTKGFLWYVVQISFADPTALKAFLTLAYFSMGVLLEKEVVLPLLFSVPNPLLILAKSLVVETSSVRSRPVS